MASREFKVVVAVPNFQSAIYVTMGDIFKKIFKPEELFLRSITGEVPVQNEHLKRFLSQVKPSALIMMDARPDEEIVSAFRSENIPIVLIDESATNVSTITTDNLAGGRIAGDYLVKKGKKKIAIVSGRTQVTGGYNAQQRLKGFEQALNAARITIPREYIVEVLHYSREDGIEAMPGLLNAGVDAVFCAAGDNCALGLMSVVKERRIKIPDEVAILGFDDLPIAQLSSPKLTTIKQPLEKMAGAAYNLIVSNAGDLLRNPQKIVFDPELVIRQSA